MAKGLCHSSCVNYYGKISKHTKHKKKVSIVDALYILTIIVAIAGGYASTCSVLKEQEFVLSPFFKEALSAFDEMIFIMAEISLPVLGARIFLASRYSQYAVVDDSRLPFVSIVIPAYNEGQQVLLTVQSVMSSDYPRERMEVVCIDDGSTDDTWEWMVQAQKDFPSRLKLVRQPQNMGKRHALLAGFKRSRGKVFVTLDSDSEILPQTLSNLVSPFVEDPRVGAVAGNVRVLNVKRGFMPKMLDISFTLSFDFFRRAQSVYGGVLCTPGALSAYRAKAIKPFLPAWADQTFLAKLANIGEDRALSNIVLGQGYRVVFQHDAVVLTMVPEEYSGLRRMLLRWARSNVRESLVMTQYLFKNFRKKDDGGWILRLAGIIELLYLPVVEALKFSLVASILLYPWKTLTALLLGGVLGAVLPAVIYQFRKRGLFGVKWALFYVFFWMTCLSWISFWGLFTAQRSGWLTRGLSKAPA